MDAHPPVRPVIQMDHMRLHCDCSICLNLNLSSNYIYLCQKLLSTVVHYIATCRLKCLTIFFLLFHLLLVYSSVQASEYNSEYDFSIRKSVSHRTAHRTRYAWERDQPFNKKAQSQPPQLSSSRKATHKHHPGNRLSAVLTSQSPPTSPPQPYDSPSSSFMSLSSMSQSSLSNEHSVWSDPFNVSSQNANKRKGTQQDIIKNQAKRKSKTKQTASSSTNRIFDFDNLSFSPLIGSMGNLSISEQPSPVPLKSVMVGVDNEDLFDTSRQNKILDSNVEHYDSFDYVSDEDLYDPGEQSLLSRPVEISENVNMVSSDYGSMFDSLYDSKLSSHRANSIDSHPVSSPQMYERAIVPQMPYSSREPRYIFHSDTFNISWPVKKVAEVPGDITLGGLMMVHEREDQKICGPIMPQGGIQALECMLHTIDYVNSHDDILPGIKLGAYILDDCDKDTYGLEQSIDFIKG